jgi:hypothetical protein
MASAVVSGIDMNRDGIPDILQRNQAAPAVPLSTVAFRGEGFNAAVASYNVQLKAWVDLQVDNRLNQVLPGFEGEVLQSRQESVTLRCLCERLEGQLAAVAEGQARLFGNVENVDEAVESLKAHLGTVEANTCSMWERDASSFSKHMSDLRQRFDKLEATHGAFERTRAQNEELLRRLAEDHMPRRDVGPALRQLEMELKGHSEQFAKSSLLDELGAELRELSSSHSRHKEDISEQRKQAALDIEERLVRTENSLERRITKLEELEPVRGEMEALAQQVLISMDAHKRDAVVRFESFQVTMAEELAAMRQKLLAEMRSELTAAFRSEAAAVTALDERLWLKDQELRQQVDKVASQRARERIAVIERSDSANAFSRAAAIPNGSMLLSGVDIKRDVIADIQRVHVTGLSP